MPRNLSVCLAILAPLPLSSQDGSSPGRRAAWAWQRLAWWQCFQASAAASGAAGNGGAAGGPRTHAPARTPLPPLSSRGSPPTQLGSTWCLASRPWKAWRCSTRSERYICSSCAFSSHCKEQPGGQSGGSAGSRKHKQTSGGKHASTGQAALRACSQATAAALPPRCARSAAAGPGWSRRPAGPAWCSAP
jgi:hypothetical protein